jgi:3-deoxy-D-manno-octulosonic-acid transferase
MALYSLVLGVALALSAPYWLVRMLFSAKDRGRYRAGLWGRLGRVPAELREAVAGRQVVWVHAVSVGEVLAATRLVAELEARLNADVGDDLGARWVIVLSTTTAAGQTLARERFGAGAGSGDRAGSAARVFWYPLDFAWAVRGYLRALRPRLLVLMESELWPRMLAECGRMGVPVAVVNARASDRSYARGVKVRAVWGRVLRRVTLYLAQSEEDGRRLVDMGARAGSVRVVGNLKYDVRAPKESRVAELIRAAAGGRPIVVAGSTVGRKKDGALSEEEMVIQAWAGALRRELGTVLVLAPRHTERFSEVASVAMEFRLVKASDAGSAGEGTPSIAEGAKDGAPNSWAGVEVVLVDTIGDLAAVYGVADVAFVGGSLVRRGGHNPLEPAQFGVPVVMGPSFENFRDVVGKMIAADGIRIVQDKDELEAVLVELLTDREAARAMGERGRRVFDSQQGATGRVVAALVGLVRDGDEGSE